MRKVSFPLKFKFIILITLLLLVTMGLYLKYALTIFKEDKAAEVYSYTLSKATSNAEKVKIVLDREFRNILNFKQIKNIEIEDQFYFVTRPELIYLSCKDTSGVKSTYNSSILSDLNITGDSIEQSISIANLKIAKKGKYIFKDVVKNLPTQLLLLDFDDLDNYCFALVKSEVIAQKSETDDNFISFLGNDLGLVFSNTQHENIKTEFLSSLISKLDLSKSNTGTTKIENNFEKQIISYSKIPPYSLISFSYILEDSAFMASRYLVNRSFIFGLLLVSIGVITGILFTKRITIKLNELFLATVELSKGNFNIDPKVGGNDEISALSDSFVDMKNKILAYMEEMKEKTRLENELQLAKLVQDSFFPKTGIVSDGINLWGHYRPASECSGDWWGFFEQDQKISLIVCDATGHGVPAALITAAAHSTISSLKLESEHQYFSPMAVLDRLNKVICRLNTNVLMTAFVLEIDRASDRIKFANASHEAAFLIKKMDGNYSKDGIIPLIDFNGPRLGEKSNSKYTEGHVDIFEGDRIVLYTDGITEAQNSAGKQYGQRNFIKSILLHANLQSDEFLSRLLSDLELFLDNKPLLDDLTLICVAVNKKLISLKDITVKDRIAKSNEENSSNIKLLSQFDNVNHLIGMGGISLSTEMQMVYFANIERGFYPEKWFQESRLSSLAIFVNKEIPNIIKECLSEIDVFFDSAVSKDSVGLVLDELLSNAFYHSNKEIPFKRGEEVILIPGENIKLEFGIFGDYLMLSVLGPSKLKSKKSLLESIKRAYLEKSPLDGELGAGLGMYLVFEKVSQLWVFSGDETNGSRIVAIFEKFTRNKLIEGRKTSFHYIDQENFNE